MEEVLALAELRRDSSKVILAADKGVALVIMDRSEYNTKAQELLNDNKTYEEINTDTTNNLKTKLISLLRKIKADGGIEEQLYKKMYPTGDVAPKFYGLPKIHKRDIPLRPTVSSRGSISYEVAKELSRILRPLVGKSPYHIKNTGDFVQQVRGINIQPTECVSSYDVSALFTSVTYRICYYHHKEQVRAGSRTPQQNNHESRAYHQPTGVLSEDHLLPVSTIQIL